MPSVEHLDNILKFLSLTTRSTFAGDEQARVAALREAQDLVNRLSTPFDWLTRQTWVQPDCLACVQIGVDVDLFTELNKLSRVKVGEALRIEHAEPVNVVDLAKATGVEERLLKRILRMLASQDIITQTKPHAYIPSSYSYALGAIPGVGSGTTVANQVFIPAMRNLPAYLKKTGYKSTTSYASSSFADWSGGQGYWEWLNERKKMRQWFDELMSVSRRLQPNKVLWLQQYPLERLVDGYYPGSTLLVDVGGGDGTDLEDFRQTLPEPLRDTALLVLQDQESVLADAQGMKTFAKNVRLMAHDFFTMQPVKGARAYFLQSILLDWPDADCQRILKKLREAMEPEYSKLLLVGGILSEGDETPLIAALDIKMMSLFGTCERTEEEWRALVESVGFEVSGVWEGVEGARGVIECVIKQQEVL